MTRPVQHQVVALFDRRGEMVPRVVIGGRTYAQDQVLPDPLCVPLPPDAVCAMCTGGDCQDDACPWAVREKEMGAAHEPLMPDLEYDPRECPTPWLES